MVHDAVGGPFRHDPGVDQLDDCLQAFDRAIVVDPDIVDVVASVDFFEWVASAAGQERPTEVRRVVVPHDRDDVWILGPELLGE